MEPWWSRPVPSPIQQPVIRTVLSRPYNLSRCTLPSRLVEEISPHRPVPPSKRVPTINPAVKTRPYRPSPLFVAVTPSRTDAVTVKMPLNL